MAYTPMSADLTYRLSVFLTKLQEATETTGIAIAFITGQEWLEDATDGELPLRINRKEGRYVAEEPYS